MTEPVYALVPMKRHSQRVPGKNLRMFAGKPLFFHILSTLLNSKYITGVYVDTDSQEIAHLVTSLFKTVEIVWRPKELVGDFVSMNRIIEYDLSQIGGEHFLQTHATNPLLAGISIETAIEQYFANLNRHDSLFSVNELHSRLYDNQLQAINHNPAKLERTQDLPPVYEENSNFYIFSRTSFSASGARIGSTPGIFITDRLESMDIDTETDFILAENMKKHSDAHNS